MKDLKKYKQTIIPSISTVNFKSNPQFIKDYYERNLQGKSVTNQHLNIPIYFTNRGKRKLAFGGNRYIKKSSVLQCLLELLEIAEFNNFGNRKADDDPSIKGYLNFKAKVLIDEKLEHVRIAVMLKENGKIYYSHEVNNIKIKVLPPD